MKVLRWLTEGASYLMIALALVAGLAASYGRELEAQRSPDRSWWIRRLLIMPVLAITATAATDVFELQPSVAAFSAAMLSLGSYDVLRLIEAKWRSRVEALASSAGEGGSDELHPRQ